MHLNVPLANLRVLHLPKQGPSLVIAGLQWMRVQLYLELCYSSNEFLGLILSFLAAEDECLSLYAVKAVGFLLLNNKLSQTAT